MVQMADRGMTLASRRVSLIASNLANIDTPGYHTQDFDFNKAFQAEMEKLDRQLSPGQAGSSFSGSFGSDGPSYRITDPVDVTYERNDGNDVRLDRETNNMAKTMATYTLSSNFAQGELRKLLGAIRDLAK